jgi:hypothetical protein
MRETSASAAGPCTGVSCGAFADLKKTHRADDDQVEEGVRRDGDWRQRWQMRWQRQVELGGRHDELRRSESVVGKRHLRIALKRDKTFVPSAPNCLTARLRFMSSIIGAV